MYSYQIAQHLAPVLDRLEGTHRVDAAQKLHRVVQLLPQALDQRLLAVVLVCIEVADDLDVRLLVELNVFA